MYELKVKSEMTKTNNEYNFSEVFRKRKNIQSVRILPNSGNHCANTMPI